MKGKIKKVYKNRKLVVWISIIFVPLIILAVGSLLARNIFWDSFLWKYFWGPIVADAEGEQVNGISAGYNLVNTITYGIILVISFFGIIELIKHFEIDIDKTFVRSPFSWVILLYWITLGGSLRSLEDAGLFNPPFDKLMITPMIYFLLGFLAILLILLGTYISRIEWKPGRSKYIRLLVLAPLPFFYLLFWNYLDPFIVSFLLVILISSILSFLIAIKYIDLDGKYIIFTYGTVMLSISLSYNVYFMFYQEGTNPWEAIIIPVSGTILTVLLLGLFWIPERFSIWSSKNDAFSILSNPLNVLICWAHLFDASSTYRGITAYGYAEKHVLPGFLIEQTGPLVIFAVKIVLILVIIYVLDILLEEDFTSNSNIRSILKLVIIILGASPAVRNTLRLAMGV